jgi:hypothetical protein
MKKFQVEIRNNPVLKKLFLEHAEKIGLKFNIDIGSYNVQSFQVGIDENWVSYSFNTSYRPDRFPIISMAEFLEIKGPQVVKLNEKYSAIVTKDNIKVGCQDFDPRVLKELLTTWESL